MPLSSVLRGFRVPNEILVRFLRANGVRSFDCDIEYGSHSESSEAAAWPATEFLRSKLADAGGDPKTKLLIFVPHVPSGNPPLHVYVTYAYVMAHAQRKFGLAELPDRAPRGLSELRSEILACAGPGGEHLLGAPGMQGEEGEDVTGSLFLVFSDEAHFPAELPLIPAVS